MNTSGVGIWWLLGLMLFYFYVFPTLTGHWQEELIDVKTVTDCISDGNTDNGKVK